MTKINFANQWLSHDEGVPARDWGLQTLLVDYLGRLDLLFAQSTALDRDLYCHILSYWLFLIDQFWHLKRWSKSQISH